MAQLTAQSASAPTYDDVAPIFSQNCIFCHSGDFAPLDLHLDNYDAIMKGSSNGTVVKSAGSAGSELIRRIKGISLPRMPLTGPPYLSDSEIALVEAWVAGGLKKGAAELAPAPPLASHRPEPGEKVAYQYVAAIFARHCVKCHKDGGLMGSPPEGFRLTSYEYVMTTDDRARVVPGNPQASELVRRIRGQARPRMPLDGPPYLEEEDIALIEEWILQGARDIEGREAAIPIGAKLRLHGTLGREWVLDELPLSVGSRTRIDKSPGAGDYVQVRARLGSDGKIIVERLRRR